MPLQAGDMLHGQYQIRRGGFGHARDVPVDVAIKEPIPGLVPAEATMRLSHEHIARTHTVFLEGGKYYIVVEYLTGGSLEFCLQPFCTPKKGGGHLRESASRP